MCISIFYAQVIGLWLVLVALAALTHEARFKRTTMEFLNHPALVTCAGLVNVAVGLLIIVSHNVWVSAWPVVVTLFGWLILLQGVMRIFAPESYIKTMGQMLAKSGYNRMNWAFLIVGLYLVWMSFTST